MLQSIPEPPQTLPGSADTPIHPHTLPGLEDTPIHPRIPQPTLGLEDIPIHSCTLPHLEDTPKSISPPSQPLPRLDDTPVHLCHPVPCDTVSESLIPALSAAAASRSSRLPCSSSGLRGGVLSVETGVFGVQGGHPGSGPYLGMWQGGGVAAGMCSRSVRCMKGRWK